MFYYAEKGHLRQVFLYLSDSVDIVILDSRITDLTIGAVSFVYALRKTNVSLNLERIDVSISG
jgi:hypothetical protein